MCNWGPSILVDHLETLLLVSDQLRLVRGQPLSRISKSGRKPGPPLLVRTNARKISNSQFSIGITAEGQAGEKYIGGAKKNGKREPEPQFVIVNEKEKILAKGKFEYG